MAAAVPPNRDNPNGLIPVGTMSGAPWTGKLRKVTILAADNTDTFIGDLVKLSPNASADGYTPAVAQAAAGDYAVGVLHSLDPDFTDEGTLSQVNYRRASTLRTGHVIWGDDVLYSMQEDSVVSTLAATDAGTNADVIVGSGDTATGLSGMEIDSSSAGTANTLQLRLHHVEEKVGNKLGDNARWIVSLNLNNDRNLTGVS